MDLSNVTAEALQELLNTIRETKEFILEQAPPVAREIITYGKASAVSCVVIGSLIFIAIWTAFLVMGNRVNKHKCPPTNNYGCDCIPKPLFWLFGSLFVVVISSVIIGHAPDAFKPFYAPKLYILDYIQNAMADK